MDTYLTLRPINFLLKCFALNCVYKKDNNIASSWSFTKIMLIIFVFSSINIFLLYVNIKMKDFKFHELTSSYPFIFAYILSFFKYLFNLVYVRKYCTKECVSYFYAYDRIDDILKMDSYNKIKMSCLKIMASNCALVIFGEILDYLAWYLTVEVYHMLTVLANVFKFVKTLTILDMSSHVIHIEYRLRKLGDIVEKLNVNNEDVSKCATVIRIVNSEATRLDRLKILSVRAEENGIVKPDHIIQLSQCYLMLIKQTEFINAMFGLRILLTCIVITIDLVNLLFISIQVLFERQLIGLGKMPFLTSILTFVATCFQMYTLAHRCEKVYRQSDRVVATVDDLIIFRNTGEEIISPLKELRKLISSRPIRFHSAHFFRIDYALFCAMMSVVITYTIIFLQNLKL